MKDLNSLWQGRLRDFAKTMSRYSRLILNDHMALILLVAFGFFSIYYQQLLTSLQSQPPQGLGLMMSAVCLLVWWAGLAWGRPLLLTYEPDKSYLFARGYQWHAVWKWGVWLGALAPSLVLAVFTLLLAPLISLGFGWSLGQALCLIVYVVAAKFLVAWAGYLGFYSGLLPKALSASLLALALAGLGAGSLWLPANLALGLLALLLILGAAFLCWTCRKLDQHWIEFEALVAQEQARRASLYRWLALFAEVPQQIPPIKRRAYLDGVLKSLSGRLGNRYAYLYLRHLVRNTAYSGIWLRVLIFFSLVIVSSQQVWLWAAAGALSTVLTLVQLMPLALEPLRHPLERLYPVGQQALVPALRPVLAMILGLQLLVYSLLLAVLAQGNWSHLGLCLLIWLAVAALGLLVYLPFWIGRHIRAN